MAEQLLNLVQTTCDGAYTAASGSLDVIDASGITATCTVGIYDQTTFECKALLTVSAVVSNTLTVASEGIDTNAASGDLVRVVQSARSLQAAIDQSLGLVLLEQHTASASTSLEFTSSISATYDHYLISIEDLRTTTGDEQYVIEVSLDGGSTWETTNYSIVLRFLRTTSVAAGNVFYTTSIGLGGDVVGMSGKLEFWKPSATTNRKRWIGTLIVDNAVGGGETYLQDIGGDYRGTSAFNAFRIRILGSSIASGTVYCYGYKK